MKNLALTICSVFILVCAHGQPKTSELTLNGIDSATAKVMIMHFQNNKNRDTIPLTTSIWLSKEVIHDIVSLLHAEIATQIPLQGTGADITDKTIGITDGVRIYFASDTSVNTIPLKASIILVSTKDGGISSEPSASCKSGKKHQDYYNHLANADLFKVSLTSSQICNGNNNCAGDSLYRTCYNCVDDPNCPVLPHNISRKSAEEMVHNFRKHSVNTTSEWFDLSFWEALDADTVYNGIHVYFGTYSKSSDQYKSLRDAFVITTTKYDRKTGTNADYFDCPVGASYRAVYNLKYAKKGISPPMMDPGQDNGELCPFNCN